MFEKGANNGILICCRHQGEHFIWRVGSTDSASPVLARQSYSTALSNYHPILPPTCSLVHLSIILYPANILTLCYSLASLAWQVHLYSFWSLLLGHHTLNWTFLLKNLFRCPLVRLAFRADYVEKSYSYVELLYWSIFQIMTNEKWENIILVKIK